MRVSATSILLALVTAFTALARTAHAVDPFEIQVYDGTANAPRTLGLELHANSVIAGRTTADPPELPQHHQSHLTLEPSFGLLPWWELGGYFQTALRSDGTLEYAGIKLRSKFVSPPGWHPHVRLGVNLEGSLLPEHYDRNHWGGEIRPIAAWENAAWLFAVNPIVDVPLAGSGFSDGPSFEPCATALYKVEAVVSFGLEYYANFGPFAALLPLRQQEHYVYEVMNLLAVEHFELNAGVGEGVTAGSNGFVAKMILGYSFEREAPARSSSRDVVYLGRSVPVVTGNAVHWK